jgi:hypothetical protein
LRVAPEVLTDLSGAFWTPVLAAKLPATGNAASDSTTEAAESAFSAARIFFFTADLSDQPVSKCRAPEKCMQDQYLARFS